jgi:epoxide hydrolase-like predicted phosphatase
MTLPIPPSPGPVQVTCWDMGGVILRTHNWRPRRKWEQRLGLRPGALESMVFEGDVSREAMVGRATVDEIWASLAARLGLSLEDRRRLTTDFFAGDGFDAALLDFIRGLRPATKTALISNAWPGARDFLEASLPPDVFDLMVISAELGVAKPDPAIYRFTLERLGVPAGAAVFVDDMPRNLEAAAAVGMRTIIFNGTIRTIEAVRRMTESP